MNTNCFNLWMKSESTSFVHLIKFDESRDWTSWLVFFLLIWLVASCWSNYKHFVGKLKMLKTKFWIEKFLATLAKEFQLQCNVSINTGLALMTQAICRSFCYHLFGKYALTAQANLGFVRNKAWRITKKVTIATENQLSQEIFKTRF